MPESDVGIVFESGCSGVENVCPHRAFAKAFHALECIAGPFELDRETVRPTLFQDL